MKIIQEFRNHPNRVLDRLVDGELGAGDRRELLAALDEEPGAWRQCALAFLEAQTWGWQLSRMASEPLVTPPPRGSVARAAATFVWPLALAASVVVAFMLGWALTEREATPRLAGEPAAVDQVLPAGSSDEAASDGDQPSGPSPTAVALSPAAADSAGEPAEEDPADLAAQDAAGQSLAVFGALERQFERDGFEVQRQQRYWPVELPDGRRVLVPVEEVNIRAPEIERL